MPIAEDAFHILQLGWPLTLPQKGSLVSQSSGQGRPAAEWLLATKGPSWADQLGPKKTCGVCGQTMAEKSGHPESSQGPSDFCTVYSQMLYQLSYSLSDMKVAYKG